MSKCSEDLFCYHILDLKVSDFCLQYSVSVSASLSVFLRLLHFIIFLSELIMSLFGTYETIIFVPNASFRIEI